MASRPVLKGTPDVTPKEEQEGILIGKNQYAEKGVNQGGTFWFSGDIFLVDEEWDLDAPIG